MKLNLANKMTLSRVVLAAVFVIVMAFDTLGTNIAALIIFIAASVTDAYDGHIARKHNMVTTLGIFLDPLADKLLISAALISFVDFNFIDVPAWMVIIIIAREFVITGLRGVAASKNIIISANKFGKFKTTSQMVAIIGILLILVLRSYITGVKNIPVEALSYISANARFLGLFMSKFPYWAMLVATILTLYSGVIYIWQNMAVFKENEKN
jgi:CDP-diacylglycerol--glycerol-3-phosphate 3-phosphatidyltransferase